MRTWSMASSPDVVEYICFQLRHAGDISFKKMFGEYGLYCDRKYFGLVCDNQLFVKITEPGLKLLPQQEQGSPYPGARPHFLMTELDDDRALSSFVRATCSVLRSGCLIREEEKSFRRKKKQASVNACLFRMKCRSAERLIYLPEPLAQPGKKGSFSDCPQRSAWLHYRTPRICPRPASGI